MPLTWGDLPPEAGAEWDAHYAEEGWVPVLERELGPQYVVNGNGTATYYHSPGPTGRYLARCGKEHSSSEKCLCLVWPVNGEEWVSLVTVQECKRCCLQHRHPQQRCADVARALMLDSLAATLEWQDKEWPNVDPAGAAVQLRFCVARAIDRTRNDIDPARATGPALERMARDLEDHDAE